MLNSSDRKSQTRLIIAGALFLTSIGASFLISYLSQAGSHYWVLTRSLPIGVQIKEADIASKIVTLSPDLKGYLPATVNPVGAITRRNLSAGLMLNSSDLTDDSSHLTTESLSLSIRSADIPISAGVGDFVSLFQIHDSRNGEPAVAPQRIISGVFIKSVERKGANFGSDVALTISVNASDVATVLAATASGRIAVVESNG